MGNFVFKLPDIGEGVVEGDVFQWHVSVGDSVVEDDQFVVLHLREKGYYDAHQHIFRNINPLQYIDTVEYFLNQGIKVVRIGHEKMTPMFERDGFIDLTRRMRPDEVDIFLCGKAKFYFGSASGPYSLSHNFGVPCCVTNALDYGGVRPNNFVQFLTQKNR